MSVIKIQQAQNGKGKALLCLEINPPKGVQTNLIEERLTAEVLSGLDFLNITDNALAVMRMAALPFAAWLKQRFGIETLVNFSCRDRNVLGMQSDLLAAALYDIKSVVALTGDAISVGDHSDFKGVFEVNSVGVLEVLRALNSGLDRVGNPIVGKTEITPGVVVNPNVKNPAAELRKLGRKIEAGACYALSQPVFDESSSVAFFKEASQMGIPLFLGLMPIGSVKVARNLNRIPGLRLSSEIDNMLDRATDADLREYSLVLCERLAEINRPYVSGYHVVSGVTPKLALKLLAKLKQSFE